MNLKEKLSKIASLDEKALREVLLIPLLGRMGFRGVTLYHGNLERGKDIVCLDYNRLGQPVYLGVVAKVGDIKGAVSSSIGMREILYQVEQCLDTEYHDLFGMKTVKMNMVWVVTNGEIGAHGREAGIGKLQTNHLDKMVHFVSGENLVQLIDEHYMAFWDSVYDDLDTVKRQRDRAIDFSSDLLKKMGAETKDIMVVRESIINNSFPPSIFKETELAVKDASSFAVTLEEFSAEYNVNFPTPSAGTIREAFSSAYEAMKYTSWETEELLENFNKVLRCTDPEEFIGAFEMHLQGEYPFHRSSGRASEAEREIFQLIDALREYKEIKDYLVSIEKWDWAKSLIESLENFKVELEKTLKNTTEKEFTVKWGIADKGTTACVLMFPSPNEKNIHGFESKHSVYKFSYQTNAHTDVKRGIGDVYSEALFKLTYEIKKITKFERDEGD